jgi:uncharacterized membrane protein (UPF0127 family)
VQSFLVPLLKGSAAAKILRNERTQRTVADRLTPAFDSTSRKTGLLRHTGLACGDAMVIAPCNAIHTFFMRFPIDVVFVAKDGRVLTIRGALPAWRIAWSLRAHAVIELCAGETSRCDIQPGDRLTVVDRPKNHNF